MTQETTNQGLPNRWLLAGGGVLMQLALGAVYAWSVFRIPLSKTFGWSIQDVTWAFSLAILALGFAAFVGGLWMRKVGPQSSWNYCRDLLRLRRRIIRVGGRQYLDF